MNNNSFTIRYL